MGRGGPQLFSLVLAEVEWLLSKRFCFSTLFFFWGGVVWLKRTGFCLRCFVSLFVYAFIGVSRFLMSSAPSQKCMTQKGNQQKSPTYPSLGPEIPSQFTFVANFLAFSHVCSMYDAPSF